MRIFHVLPDSFTELQALPDGLPADGFLWIGTARREFEECLTDLQAALQRYQGRALVDLHVRDLLNHQLPSNYDYTSWYDLLVFRRLAPAASAADIPPEGEPGTSALTRRVPETIDTSPVGFALFDRVLLTVHPEDCQVRERFAQRLAQLAAARDTRTRLPTSPADLMLRMVNHMVDGYLELRRQLSRQSSELQRDLLRPESHFIDWPVLLDSRNTLHMLEETCEDQRSAMQDWIDELQQWPEPAQPAAARDQELLRVRSRDVLEHIERVLSHVRRLEQSSEAAVQMHFSAQSQRTNDIMRTLTVLTAIFLPLNLITGIFGMNFDALPLVHNATGFWVAFGAILLLGIGLGVFFWRKRYLGTRARNLSTNRPQASA
jgi:Mg2+ and Co2+ transporter CorA